MAGRISGLGTAGVYVNPDMPASVVQALAKRGLMPDGSPIAGLGTAFNRVLNPIRGALGVEQGELPPGVEPVDYAALLDSYDGAMAGFGGADTASRGTGQPADPMAKMQDRVPPSPVENPPEEMAAPAEAPDPYFGLDTAMKLAKGRREIDAGYDRTNALVDALLNPAEEEASAVADTPRRPISGMAFTPGLPKQPEAPKPPIPRPRPAPTAYTVKAGDNPTTIARALGISLAELERKNPGILKKARRLKVGSEVKA